jgi:Tfp pilus assembly protein PilF
MKRFEKLEAEYSEKETTPLDGLTSVPFSALTEYFRSHPPASERRAALQAQIVARHWNDSTALRPFLIRNIFLTDAGERLARAGDFANSTAQFQKAVNIAPNYTRAWRGLAEVRWCAADAEGTLSAVAMTIHQLPTDRDWILAARALAALDSKDAVKRLATLENEATVVVPHEVDSVPKIEIAGLKLTKEQGNAHELLAVLPTGQSPSVEARARTEVAWWFHSAGKLEDAASQLLTARQLMPQALDSNLLLAWVLSDLGRQADAMDVLEKSEVSSTMPSWQQRAESEAVRSVVEWRTENRDAAKAGFQEAARNDSSWMIEGWVRNNYGASVTGVVRQLQAIELARRAQELQERQGNITSHKTE